MKPVAVVFDLFGTLLDIASLRDVAAEMANDPDAFVATWREKQIAYAFASTIMDEYEDFDAMTAYALRYAAAKYGVALDSRVERRLVAAWRDVRPYDDVVPALRSLRGAGIPCTVLTNGTVATANAAIESAGIGPHLDATLSVDAVRVYKPDRRVYELATSRYGVAPEQLIFVTSNGWDAAGAGAFGMRVAWCNRANAPAETFGPPPAWTIGSMHALPALTGSR